MRTKPFGQLTKKEWKAAGGYSSLRRARISPKKMKLIADLIKGLNVQEADYILQFTPKKGARIMRKVLRAAVASYRDKFVPGSDLDALYPHLRIAIVKVDRGPMWKIPKPAVKPARFGGNGIFRRRTSHITVVVLPENKRKEGN
ncbi:MAG: 50S ribosomal protein L22 [Thermotogae bacterium]|nr:50S ribosomal protein L22 [Thermotogota bacterium]